MHFCKVGTVGVRLKCFYVVAVIIIVAAAAAFIHSLSFTLKLKVKTSMSVLNTTTLVKLTGQACKTFIALSIGGYL